MTSDLRCADPPALPSFIRHRRHSRGLSQTQLATETGYSVTYIAKIEQGQQQVPTPAVLDQIAAALTLSSAERNHLFYLAGRIPDDADGADAETELNIGEIERSYVDGLMPHLAAFVDDRWNVLHANAKYYHIYRELDIAQNVLVWFFEHSVAKTVMVEWEQEARLTVGWLRTLMAKGPVDRFMPLLERLSANNEFQAMWSKQEVVDGRRTMPMHVYDLDTSEIHILRAQVWPAPTRPHLLLYLGLLSPSAASELR